MTATAVSYAAAADTDASAHTVCIREIKECQIRPFGRGIKGKYMRPPIVVRRTLAGGRVRRGGGHIRRDCSLRGHGPTR